MESLAEVLNRRLAPRYAVSKTRTNKYWLLAEKIALATHTKPNRWLRAAKTHEYGCIRALASLAELHPRNPAAYFAWLLKHK